MTIREHKPSAVSDPRAQTLSAAAAARHPQRPARRRCGRLPQISALATALGLGVAGVAGTATLGVFRGRARTFNSERELIGALETTPDIFADKDMVVRKLPQVRLVLDKQDRRAAAGGRCHGYRSRQPWPLR